MGLKNAQGRHVAFRPSGGTQTPKMFKSSARTSGRPGVCKEGRVALCFHGDTPSINTDCKIK